MTALLEHLHFQVNDVKTRVVAHYYMYMYDVIVLSPLTEEGAIISLTQRLLDVIEDKDFTEYKQV